MRTHPRDIPKSFKKFQNYFWEPKWHVHTPFTPWITSGHNNQSKHTIHKFIHGDELSTITVNIKKNYPHKIIFKKYNNVTGDIKYRYLITPLYS